MAGDLGIDHLLQRVPVVVGELVGVEVTGHARNQGVGHGPLLRTDVHVRLEEAEIGLTHLVGPDHRREHDDAVAHPQQSELLAVADRHLHEPGLATGVERVTQQQVGLEGRLLRLQVIALREVDRVDLIGRHELQHVHHAGTGQWQVGEVFVGEHNRLPRGQLIALGDVGVGHLFAVGLGHPAVPDTRSVGAPYLMEADVLLLRRGVQLHPDTDQPEGDAALPDRAHDAGSPGMSSAT